METKKKRKPSFKSEYNTAIFRIDMTIESYGRVIDLEDDETFKKQLASRLEKLERKKVQTIVELMDKLSLHAQCELFNCGKDQLVEILYKAKLNQDKEKEALRQIFLQEFETSDEKKTSITTKEMPIKVNGFKIKQIIEKTLNAEPKPEWYKNGKIIKSRVYQAIADKLGTTSGRIKVQIMRYYKENFDTWANKSYS